MSKQDIINYVMNSPENTNPVILKQLVDDIATGINLKLVDESELGAFSLEGANMIQMSGPKIKKIGGYFFAEGKNLLKVDFPDATEIEYYVFLNCSKLVNINLPKVESIGVGAFENCTSLCEINLPEEYSCESSFNGCTNLNYVNLGKVRNTAEAKFQRDSFKILDLPIGELLELACFENCQNLIALILRNETKVPSFAWDKENQFIDVPIFNSEGYIYVPQSLKKSCEAQYEKTIPFLQFRAIEDYTIDKTLNGKLDLNKILTTTPS